MKKEIRTLKSRIAELKKEENELHKEAKRRTRNYLEERTGYRVSYRILEELLAEANKSVQVNQSPQKNQIVS